MQALQLDDTAVVQVRSDEQLGCLVERAMQEQMRRKMDGEARRMEAQMEAQRQQIAEQVREGLDRAWGGGRGRWRIRLWSG